MIIKIFLILTGLFFQTGLKYPLEKLPQESSGYIALALPDSFTFCGERIPLEITDVRERMEDIYYARTGNDDRIFLQLKRTRKYFPYFEKILKEMEAPDDLKYLSVAESSLRIDAYSNADAAGLWQFIPSTAKLWGLHVDKQIDERFHVEKSTRASIRMLKSLREELGSWSLAAAAYNNGQANIAKVVREQKTNDYFELFLNKETRNYIFHIAVLKEILEHPKKYGYQLTEKDYYPPYDIATQKITVSGPINDLGQWAKDQGTNYKTVKLHNYWIMKNTLPDGNWELILPASLQIKEVKRDSSTVRADSVSDFFIIHLVQEGESLTKISKLYGVTQSNIVRWNGLKSDAVFVDSKLRIQLTPSQQITHVVRSGDTLIRLAERYRVRVDQIKEWNKLAGETLVAGKSLVIYAGKAGE
jgi:LysM repeat protein